MRIVCMCPLTSPFAIVTLHSSSFRVTQNASAPQWQELLCALYARVGDKPLAYAQKAGTLVKRSSHAAFVYCMVCVLCVYLSHAALQQVLPPPRHSHSSQPTTLIITNSHSQTTKIHPTGDTPTSWLPPKSCLLPDTAIQASPTLSLALAKLGVPLLGLPAGVACMLAVQTPFHSRPGAVTPQRYVCLVLSLFCVCV